METPRARQLRLFEISGAWEERFGSAFFRGLPRVPGVYYFYDSIGKLLYVGQSNNLRARISSYRHVQAERHPKRTLRMVQRVSRIEWEICASAEEALRRESEQLLALRPPFNRAGVWQAPPWWLRVETESAGLKLTPVREAERPAEASFGPFRGSFPFVYAAMVRIAHRELRSSMSLSDFPAGLLRDRLISEVVLRCEGESEAVSVQLPQYFAGESDALIARSLTARTNSSADRPIFELRLWDADLELARDYYDQHLIADIE